MVRARILLAAVLAVAALAVIAGPASASAPAANTAKYCKAMNGLSDKLANATADSLSEGRAVLRTYASRLKTAASNAPKKVKNATKNLASFYNALASGDANAFKNTKNIGTSAVTIGTYIAAHCNG